MKTVARKALGLAAFAGLASLGNMRPAVSDASPSFRPDVQIDTVMRQPAREPVPGDRIVIAGNGDPEDVPTSKAVSANDGRLIPAIYAPDPDARSVHRRHVHKWM